jgi:hypothetical protein
MNNKRHSGVLLFSLLISHYCLSQNRTSHFSMFPKVRAKLDSLYPHASKVILEINLVSDSIQTVDLKCNCKEDSGLMAITFDTNGNWLHKNTTIAVKKLPNYIYTYLITNGFQNYRYREDVMMKSVDNKGEISYSINIAPPPVEGPTSGTLVYVLKFKSSGEFISNEKRWVNL